ncbi:hypothetical protein AB4142_29995, partial [Variovorax sp. 2RAF20]
MIDPFARKVVAIEALLRTPSGDAPQAYFDGLTGDALYNADLESKKVAFAMATALDIGAQTLSVNLL